MDFLLFLVCVCFDFISNFSIFSYFQKCHYYFFKFDLVFFQIFYMNTLNMFLNFGNFGVFLCVLQPFECAATVCVCYNHLCVLQPFVCVTTICVCYNHLSVLQLCLCATTIYVRYNHLSVHMAN